MATALYQHGLTDHPPHRATWAELNARGGDRAVLVAAVDATARREARRAILGALWVVLAAFANFGVAMSL